MFSDPPNAFGGPGAVDTAKTMVSVIARSPMSDDRSEFGLLTIACVTWGGVGEVRNAFPSVPTSSEADRITESLS